jgi:hypothetical protein
MSFAGVILACWLGIAGVAFLALSGLGRIAAHGDVEANLGIVGDAELRMLIGEREQRPSLEARLAQLGASSAHGAWASREGMRYRIAGRSRGGHTT